MPFEIHDLDPSYRYLLGPFIEKHWRGVSYIVSRGKIHQAEELKGFVAVEAEKILGMLGYRVENNECEVVTLDSEIENIGIGSALMKAVEAKAKELDCKGVWLVTTNDNTHALRFYQKLGYTLKALYPKALEASRKLKPSIPLIGNDNIPLRDEIELEKIF